MGISNISSITNNPRLSNTKKVLPIKRYSSVKAKKERVVRFTSDNEIVQVPKSSLAEKSILWWTKDERRDILDNNQRIAQDFRQYHNQEVEHCNEVFDQCCDDSDDSEEEDSETEYDPWRPRLELPTHVRGLEWGFCPRSKKYRRVHVRNVLNLQAKIRDSCAHKPQLLSTHAIQSSRPCRALARILGEGDASALKKTTVVRRNRCRMLPSWW